MTLTYRSTVGRRLTVVEGDGNVAHLADSSGIAFVQSGSGTVATTASEVFTRTKSVFDYMTAAQRTDVLGGTGAVDVSAAVQAAINAIDNTGGKGGTVVGPAGVYNFGTTTINGKARVRVKFAGSRSTLITYTGTGDAILDDSVDSGGFEGFRLSIGTSATAVGLHLSNASSGDVRHRQYKDIEIAPSSSVVGGQIGIHQDVTAPDLITENVFDDIRLINIAKPIVRGVGPEGNSWSNILIQDYGTGTSPVAIDGPANAEQYTNLRIAASGLTTPVGIQETGARNVYHASIDIGATGTCLNSSGTRNIFFLQRAAGTTPIGTFSVTDQVIDAGHNTLPRVCANGTALVAGDFALSAGWGNTASVGAISGTDMACTFTITSAGTGQGANPTCTLTFKDGAWPATPKAIVCTRGGGNQLALNLVTLSKSTTAVTLYFTGTPSAGETYTFNVITIG